MSVGDQHEAERMEGIAEAAARGTSGGRKMGESPSLPQWDIH